MAFNIACKLGNIKLIKLLINNGAGNWNRGFINSCEFNHLPILKIMISKGADDWNYGLEKASENGHLIIVQYLIDNGRKDIDLNTALLRADKYNKTDIVKLLKSLIDAQKI